MFHLHEAAGLRWKLAEDIGLQRMLDSLGGDPLRGPIPRLSRDRVPREHPFPFCGPGPKWIGKLRPKDILSI